MRRLISIIGGLVLGIALSQFPEYAQQYTQRLGGAVNELRAITEDFDRRASEAGLTRQQAILRFEAMPDTFVASHGKSSSQLFSRYEMLSATLDRVRNAGPLERLQLLPSYLDDEIGVQTLEDFKPAIPVTLEGLLYGGAGLLFGYVLLSALMTFLMLPFRRRYPTHYRRI